MIIYNYILFLCLLIPSFTFAQEVNIIPTTNISMILPDGFNSGTHPTFFKKGEKASISIMELQGIDYHSMMSDFKANLAKDKSVGIRSDSSLNIDGFDGQQVEYDLINGERGVVIVFGDDSFSVILIGQYRRSYLYKEIRKALYSVKYNKR